MGKSTLGELPMRKAFLRSAALTVVTIILIMTAAFGSVYADPEAVVLEALWQNITYTTL